MLFVLISVYWWLTQYLN